MPVNLERSDGVGIITIDRPRSMNAMDSAAYSEISEALLEIDADREVFAGIITGAGGRAFSAGADLKQMHGRSPKGDRWKPHNARRWDLGLTVSKPLIAAIDGYALAGGLELALFCDIRIATPRSSLGAPEVKWNLLHGFGATRLPAIVGLGNAMMLLLTADPIDATEALRIGLVNAVVEPETLMEEALRIATTIASRAPDAIGMTKQLALRGLEVPLDQNIRLYQSYMAVLEGTEEQLRRTEGFTNRKADPAGESE